MSERSKGDTSSSVAAQRPSGRVVKNTLLSASVTGLTFDDFENKPLLLPAAPPIIHSVPVVSTRESTPLVTVGKSSDIDSENLSEVNLNDFSGTTTSNTADISDENSNSLIEPSTQADNSILSQAASSFSQLPSVASSVFSTFSKKFNSSSERDDINLNSNQQLNIQPFTTPFVNPAAPHIPQPPIGFENQEQQQSVASQNEADLPKDPPTFYSPTEVPVIPSTVPGPPLVSGQNTYRISAKKKIYAPIPGLSSAHQEQNFPSATANFLPPIGFEASPVPVYPEQSFNKPEERKGGRFSLSNLVPAVPNVLQNLSGLVQSAAGSLTQKPQESLQQPPTDNFGPFQVNTTGQVPSVFYSTGQVDQTSQQAPIFQPSPAPNFFASSVPESTELPPQSISAPSFAGEAPTQVHSKGQVQPIGNFFTSIPRKSDPTTIPPVGPDFPPTSSVQPPQRPLPGGILFPGLPSTNISPELKPGPDTFAPANLPVFPPIGKPPSAGLNIASSQLPPSTGILFAGLPPKSNTLEGTSISAQQQLHTLPLPAKPPSGGPPSASFRLQKGTRLYKSPFTSTSAPSEYKQQSLSGYPATAQSIIPLSEATAVSPFNPLQQGFVTSQQSFQPFIPGREAVSATILTPPSATEGNENHSAQEGIIPLSTANILHSSEVELQENSFSSFSTNQPLERLTQPATPPAGNQSISDAPKELSTVKPVDVSEKPILEQPVTLNPIRDSLQAQENLGQSILLPPPPASTFGTQSKETANFPPPPPQHSFQNKLNLNPYRRGLQAHHSQLSTPAAVSTIFTPHEQDTSIFKPIASDAVNTTSQVASFLGTELPATAPVSTILTSNVKDTNIFKPIAAQALSTPPQDPPYIAAQLPVTPPVSTVLTPKEQTNNFKSITSESGNLFTQGSPSSTAQLPAPTSILSTNEQDTNLFKPIETQCVSQSAPSIATFFTKPSEIDGLAKQTKPVSSVVASQPSEVFKEITEIIPPSITPADRQPTNSTSEAFSSILTSPNFLHDSPSLVESTVSTPSLASSLAAQPTPVSSFLITATAAIGSTTGLLQKDSEEKRAIPASTSNLVSFFNDNPHPLDPFSVDNTKNPVGRTESQDNFKPLQLAASVPATSAKIASPLKSREKSESQQSVPNLFTSFFEQSAPVAVTPAVNQSSLPDPTSFFDSFSQLPSVGVDAPPPEDPNSQRIQNFFNNPPPKDLDPVGDLNYNLVGSGLSVKNLQTRSLTPASNLAEPPSSSCSEFSELNSSLSAANKHARAPAEDSNKVSPEEESIFEAPDNLDLPEDILNEIKMANSAVANSNPAVSANVVYKPAVKHWFYKRKLDTKFVWNPFSYYDSGLMEEAFLLGDDGPNLVAVEGGRYDVNISERTKAPVYWEGEPIEVKRCSWFYKASDSKYVPYEEEIADLLEEEYRKASDSCEWHKKIPISGGDMVVFHGPTVIVHFQQQLQLDSWGGSTLDSESFLSYIQQQTKTRPRVVKRDLEDFTIDEGESDKVDHLLYMVHGIGSACDLKMRTVEEVVDEFRAIALQLVQSHYKNSVENGFVGRVEVLPISWHSELHSEELGIDEKLKSITLESIPKLRNFTNDTLLDILFYTSPMFCQRIMNTVTASMNSVFIKYKERNPDFHGRISLAGHSLGSLILFDLLCHQRPLKECEEQNMENPDQISPGNPVDSNQLNEDEASRISYKMGPAGTGQPFISYPQLLFQPKKFFALGSPIGMFVTIRGIDKLGLDFRLPTCSGFYNIFHPYDPVAYRLEALVNPDMNGIPPVLIPHHKGRKRMHLELKETMTRVGADLKQRFFDTFKTTFDSVRFLAPKPKDDSKEIEKQVNKVLELQAQEEAQQDTSKKYDPKEIEKEIKKVLELQTQQEKQGQSLPSTSRSRANSNSTNQSENDIVEIDLPLGKLNDSKRIDYVLQEAPLEFFNEYLFALSSHVCYWESEDTILFVMKEIYNGIGFSPDSQVPQQTMTIERPSSSGSVTHSPTS